MTGLESLLLSLTFLCYSSWCAKFEVLRRAQGALDFRCFPHSGTRAWGLGAGVFSSTVETSANRLNGRAPGGPVEQNNHVH